MKQKRNRTDDETRMKEEVMGNMDSKRNNTIRNLAIASSFAVIFQLTGCPKPGPEPTPKTPDRQTMEFPWLMWNRPVEGRLHVVKSTERRIIAIEYGELEGGRLEPIAVVGLETETGQERWRRQLRLKLANPDQPWSVQIALRERVLAVWLADQSLLGIDLFTGHNFWEKPRPESMGVKAVGFGFVTAWQDKVFFLKPESGEVMNTFDIPAKVTAPLVISEEGEAVMVCEGKLVGLDLNSGKVNWTHEMDLAGGRLPAKEPRVSEDRVILSHDTVDTIEKTQVMRLDAKTLQPKWETTLQGRVRTHNAIWEDVSELQLLMQMRDLDQVWQRLNPADGEMKGTLEGRDRARCLRGRMRLYCPYRREGANGIEALDIETMESLWTWETIGDSAKNEHKYINGVMYVADMEHIIGLDASGQTVFKGRVAFPDLNLQVNRILGAHNGVLVVTVVDWGDIGQAGKGEIWGIDLKTSRRRWRRELPGTLYTIDAVRMKGGFVYYMDHLRIHLVRADTGASPRNWIHKMEGKPPAPPRLVLEDDLLYAVRGENLAVFNRKTTSPMWGTKLEAGSRVVGALSGLLIVRSIDKKIHAYSAENSKKLWSLPWGEPADPQFLDLSGSADGGLLIAGREGSKIVSIESGKKIKDHPGVRHIRRLENGDILSVQVRRSVPTAEKEFVVLEISRTAGEVKLKEMWRKPLPRAKDSREKSGYSWWTTAGAYLLFNEKSSGCLKAVDLYEGKTTWKNCEPDWPVPPLFYRGYLYAGTGGLRPTKPADIQGLLQIDIETGKSDSILRIPGPETAVNRFLVNSPAPIKDGVLYILTHGPRLRGVKVSD